MRARRATSARRPSGSGGSCGLLHSRGPDLRIGCGLFLLGGPQLVTRMGELDGNSLDTVRDDVERLSEAQIAAELVERAVLTKGGERLVGVLPRLGRLFADERLEILVGHFDAFLRRDRVEDELTLHGLLGLRAERGGDVLLRLTGHREVRLGRDPALLERAENPPPKIRGSPVDERVGALDLRDLDERVDRVLAELDVELGGELLAELRLELGAKIRQRLELARRTGELVVE